MGEIKKIEYKPKNDLLIKFEKIENFTNICRVTGLKEYINIELEYIPNNYLIEIGSYRNYMYEENFNLYIEELAEKIFNDIYNLIKPKYLKITLYLVDGRLTPWNVTIQKGVKGGN